MGGDRSGRTVIVTGAGSGLGRAMTLRLLREGYRCVLAGPAQGLEETIALAGEEGRPRATAVVCDVREPGDRQRLMAHAVAQPGFLYGLVNNAGIARAAPLLAESAEDWRDVFETNLEAVFFLSQQAVEHMRPRREGRVVNIASMYGVVALNNQGYGERAPGASPGDRGPVRQSAYDASKGGLIHLTKTLAAAVGPWGITVNAVSPGSVPWTREDADTAGEGTRKEDDSAGAAEPPGTAHRGAKRAGLGDKIDPEILRALAAQVPMRRLGKSAEIAGPVSFLLSDDASYITGHNLVIDGGFTIW